MDVGAEQLAGAEFVDILSAWTTSISQWQFDLRRTQVEPPLYWDSWHQNFHKTINFW